MDAELHREFIARNLFNSISFSRVSECMRTKLQRAVRIFKAPSCHRATFFSHGSHVFLRPRRNQLGFIRSILLRLRKGHSKNDDTISRGISSKKVT